MYHDIDINLSNIPDCLVQHNKQNETFFSGVNILDYVAPDELIPITIETIDYDSKKHNDSIEPVIQDTLNSISNDCTVPIFVEKGRIPIKKVGNARREAKSVDPLISDENNFVDFKIGSCVEEDYHEQGDISLNPNLSRSENTDADENPLDLYKCASNETVLINTSHENEFISIAPDEGSVPVPFSHDLFCEELSHPHLFPYEKFTFQIKRQTPLSPTEYFNQRLLNYTHKFFSDSDHIFFAHKVMQSVNFHNQINIAMRKVTSDKLTAGMLSSNFKDKVKDFIASDQAFTFMNSIKGAPAYCKKFLFDVLAMVKQLGCPTFLMTLPSADLRWNELISIIAKLNNLKLSEEDINKIPYHSVSVPFVLNFKFVAHLIYTISYGS